MKKNLSVYWVRRDFRLEDNPALTAAMEYARQSNSSFLPIFILEEYMCANNPLEQFGFPSKVFLSKALPLFAEHFKTFALVRGRVIRVFEHLSKKYDLSIFVNEDIHEDFYAQLKKLRDAGVKVELCRDMLTVSKDVTTGAGNRYSVFTPFKKAVWEEFVATEPLPKPPTSEVEYLEMAEIKDMPHMLGVNSTAIAKELGDEKIFRAGNRTYDISELVTDRQNFDAWYFEEKEAIRLFKKFVKEKLSEYKEKRDSLELEGTSRMSLALAWGLVSARILVHIIKRDGHRDLNLYDLRPGVQGAIHFVSELIWREFYKYLYYHHPKLMHEEFQEKFRGTIEWLDKDEAEKRFVSWIKGETGYPIVDAAMHEIAKTGYMHNRARMIVASVLTKNLGVDWRYGQEYFRAMLIDLDEASNNGGWQWGASVGADPKPIRIFNPYLQAENYDPRQIYQKKYLPKEYFKNPPKPIVEHRAARSEALKRYGLSEEKDGHARDY